MDELTFERSLRDRPPTDPHYRPRLTSGPGSVAVATKTRSAAEARARSMLATARLVAAAAIVALFGGFLLAGVLMQPSEDALPAVGSASPESTTFPPIQLPADIPADVRSGSLETPLGPARWVHLTGDETSLPWHIFGLLSTQDGYIMVDSDPPTSLWRSPDLIEWIHEPLDFVTGSGHRWLWRAGDTYWLSVGGSRDGGPSLWRSPDTESWEQVSLQELDPPGPAGSVWVVGLDQPATYDGATVFPLRWHTDYWVALRELPGLDDVEYLALVEAGPGVFDVRGLEAFDPSEVSADPLATLRMEDTERGLRVIDDTNGTELMVLEGVNLDFIERLAVRDGSWEGDDFESFIDRLAVSDGSREGYDVVPWGPAIVDGAALESVELPLANADRSVSLTVTADESGFALYTTARDGLVQVYRSQDGRTWNETDWNDPDIFGDDVLEPRPFPPDGGGSRIAGGWIQGPMASGDGRVSFIRDDGERASLDISDLIIAALDECGAVEGLVSPNTVATTWDCPGHRAGWIVTLDDIPASGSTPD